MGRLEMSDRDIYISFKQAKNQGEQIKILAELNGTSKDTIKEIVERMGAEVNKMEHKKRELTPEQKAKKSAYMKEYFKRKKEQAGSQPDPIEEAAAAPVEELIPFDDCQDLIKKAMCHFYEDLMEAIEDQRLIVEEQNRKLVKMISDRKRCEDFLGIVTEEEEPARRRANVTEESES